jgi:hypothetical protein
MSIRQLASALFGSEQKPFVPCCAAFAEMLANAGGTGFFVSARMLGSLRSFWLEAQPFANDGMREWLRMNGDGAFAAFWSTLAARSASDLNAKLKMGFGMRRCISCGADLEELIHRQPRAFDELARAHADLENQAPVRR